MNTRVLLWYGAVVLSFILFAIGAGMANASCCGSKYEDQIITCGYGLPCAYPQHASYCGFGGCRDCIDCAGSGQCTCGTMEYCTAVTFKCGLSRRDHSLLNLKPIAPKLPRWVEVAVRNCRGTFELFDPSPVRPIATSRSLGGGQ